MDKLTEKILSSFPRDIFTDQDVMNVAGGSADSRYGLVKRACANKAIIRIKRGLYCLSPQYQRRRMNLYEVAQYIYGPSYVSMESALAYHGWIPESVPSMTLACMKKSKIFITPLGIFNFKSVPVNVFYSEVDRIVPEGGGAFFVAKPVKALADYVYVHKERWKEVGPIVTSLRVEPDLLKGISKKEIDALLKVYTSKRVQQFIQGLKKDLKR